jgi:hypothetical protein
VAARSPTVLRIGLADSSGQTPSRYAFDRRRTESACSAPSEIVTNASQPSQKKGTCHRASTGRCQQDPDNRRACDCWFTSPRPRNGSRSVVTAWAT